MNLCLDTDRFEPEERFEAFRDGIVRRLFQLELVNRADGPYRALVDLEITAPAVFGRVDGSSADFFRSEAVAKQCEPGAWLLINRNGAMQMTQGQIHARLGIGDGMLGAAEIPHDGHCLGQSDTWIVQIRNESIRNLCAPRGQQQAMILRGTMPMTRMITGMLEAYFQNAEGRSEQAATLFGQYLSDLMVLYLGASRDGAALIESRGLMVARRRSIIEDIRMHAANPAYDVHDVSRRMGLSLRYIYLLLEETGKSFSEHVIDRRIELARRALDDATTRGRTISSIAFDSGFSDLSYFNRTFRARYGATPSEVRQMAFDNEPK
jgi:AraC-like DNA-binding protein